MQQWASSFGPFEMDLQDAAAQVDDLSSTLFGKPEAESDEPSRKRSRFELPVAPVAPVAFARGPDIISTPTSTPISIPSPFPAAVFVRRDPRLLSPAQKAEYRRTVAIPRYLAKRARRDWSKKSLHLSRRVAANRRSRKDGKFSQCDVFRPASQF